MIATFTLHATGQKVSAELKEIERKYLIHFRRPDNYEGEFGFDWMRDNYKEICNDYEALKKEYYDAEKKEKVEIEGQEYFVPWLSMFPNQKGVKLKLEVEKIDNYQVRDDDYIELPAKAGVRFNPDTFKVSEINENTLVEVICKTPLQNDITIGVKNNKGDIVGKLNVFKNDVTYKLPITIVNVSGNNLNSNEVSAFEIQKIFSTQSFQQALIETNIKINKLDVNQEDLLSKEALSILVKEDNTEIVVANEKTLDILTEINTHYHHNSNIGVNLFILEVDRVHFRKYKSNEANYQDFDVYEEMEVNRNGNIIKKYKYICRYSEMQIDNSNGRYFVIGGGQVGESRVIPTAQNSCIVYKDYDKKESMVHEIGHLLGLSEIFKSLLSERTYNRYKQKQTLTSKEEEYVKDYEIMSKYHSFLFEMGHTDNYMDYYTPILYSKSPYKNSFYRWQWIIMQYEITNYIKK